MRNLVYYHGSDALYDFPSMDVITAPSFDKPVKCALGYYVTTDKKLAASCGKYLYRIELRADVAEESWELSRMKQMYNGLMKLPHEIGCKAFNIKRRQFAYGSCADIVHIVELDGSVVESVIVDLDCISSIERIERS